MSRRDSEYDVFISYPLGNYACTFPSPDASPSSITGSSSMILVVVALVVVVLVVVVVEVDDDV